MRHKHFLQGDLKLKCTATISTVYWKSNEESVQGSGFNAHTAPVSESRGRTSGEFGYYCSFTNIVHSDAKKNCSKPLTRAALKS